MQAGDNWSTTVQADDHSKDTRGAHKGQTQEIKPARWVKCIMDMCKDFNQDHIFISAPAASMFTLVPSFQQLEPTVNVLGDKSHNLSSKYMNPKLLHLHSFVCYHPCTVEYRLHHILTLVSQLPKLSSPSTPYMSSADTPTFHVISANMPQQIMGGTRQLSGVQILNNNAVFKICGFQTSDFTLQELYIASTAVLELDNTVPHSSDKNIKQTVKINN